MYEVIFINLVLKSNDSQPVTFSAGNIAGQLISSRVRCSPPNANQTASIPEFLAERHPYRPQCGALANNREVVGTND